MIAASKIYQDYIIKNNLLMMNENQLIETVQSFEDYRATAEALTHLWEHKSNVCEPLALDILVKKRGDPQLQATAFNILYSVNINQALSFAKTHLAQVHPYLLGAILEQLAEDVAIVNEKDNLREVVYKVKTFLDEKGSNELKLIKESIQWFKETFAGTYDDAIYSVKHEYRKSAIGNPPARASLQRNNVFTSPIRNVHEIIWAIKVVALTKLIGLQRLNFLQCQVSSLSYFYFR